MDREKLKLIVKNLKLLVESLESEVYSDVDAYKYENYKSMLPETVSYTHLTLPTIYSV